MTLNITARRRVELKDFAIGWDGCYLVVRVATEAQRRAYTDAILKLQDELNAARAESDNEKQRVANEVDEKVERAARTFAQYMVTSGVVLSTDDDGNESEVSFSSTEDVAQVLAAFNYSWIDYIVETSIGIDRLKAKN